MYKSVSVPTVDVIRIRKTKVYTVNLVKQFEQTGSTMKLQCKVRKMPHASGRRVDIGTCMS